MSSVNSANAVRLAGNKRLYRQSDVEKMKLVGNCYGIGKKHGHLHGRGSKDQVSLRLIISSYTAKNATNRLLISVVATT